MNSYYKTAKMPNNCSLKTFRRHFEPTECEHNYVFTYMFTELFFEREIKQIKLILSVLAIGPFIFLILFELKRYMLKNTEKF